MNGRMGVLDVELNDLPLLDLLTHLVSMIDGELFDKLEEIARRLKKNKKPFGGIQVHTRTSKLSLQSTRASM